MSKLGMSKTVYHHFKFILQAILTQYQYPVSRKAYQATSSWKLCFTQAHGNWQWLMAKLKTKNIYCLWHLTLFQSYCMVSAQS